MRVAVNGTLRRGDWSLRFNDLEIEPGVTAVTGANGLGKSSLLRLVAGLEAIDDGRVTFDGTPVDDPASAIFVECHRRPVAVVFQDIRLFPHLRVIDNVAFAMRRRGVPRAEARERATGFLDRVGMSEFARSKIPELSGGQLQRVAIARALATQARLLLLDEPLSSVDEASKPAIRRLFTDSTFETVVWVTHGDEDARSADRVISLPNSVT